MATKKTKRTTLTAGQKGKRYSQQIKAGKVKETNKKLSSSDLAFRKGYVKALADSKK